MILQGADETILHRSGRIVEHLDQIEFSVQVDPIDWVRTIYLHWIFFNLPQINTSYNIMPIIKIRVFILLSL